MHQTRFRSPSCYSKWERRRKLHTTGYSRRRRRCLSSFSTLVIVLDPSIFRFHTIDLIRLAKCRRQEAKRYTSGGGGGTHNFSAKKVSAKASENAQEQARACQGLGVRNFRRAAAGGNSHLLCRIASPHLSLSLSFHDNVIKLSVWWKLSGGGAKIE